MAAPPRRPVLSRDSRAHLESAAAWAREELAALQGQGLRRARAPDVLRGPRGLQHARPDGPHSAAAAGAPDRRGFYVAVGRCGYVPPEELTLSRVGRMPECASGRMISGLTHSQLHLRRARDCIANALRGGEVI